MDGPSRRMRSRLDPNAADFVPAANEGSATRTTPQMDMNTSIILSSSEADELVEYLAHHPDDDNLEKLLHDMRTRNAQASNPVANEGRVVLSLPLLAEPAPSPPDTTPTALVEATVNASTRRSGRTLRDWLTPDSTTPTPRSQRVPSSHWQKGMRNNRSVWARCNQERFHLDESKQGHLEESRAALLSSLRDWTAGYSSSNGRIYDIPRGSSQALSTDPIIQETGGLLPDYSHSARATRWNNILRNAPRMDLPIRTIKTSAQNTKNKRKHDEVERPPPPADDNSDPSDPSADDEVVEPPSKFHPFLRLPFEIREHIYQYALNTGRPILPQLCDADYSTTANRISLTYAIDQDERPKFHDVNHPTHHTFISTHLGITRVSHQLRSESLPVFYATNIFYIGQDTSSYFDHLQYLGRFGMIRNVQFQIAHRLEKRASETLRGLSAFLERKKTYEDALQEVDRKRSGEVGWRMKVWDGKGKGKGKLVPEEKEKGIAELVGASREALTRHPQYLVGGLADLNVLICLGKLCTVTERTGANRAFASASSTTTTPTTTPTTQYQNPSTLTLPIPSASVLTSYPTLSWFPLVATGLGITLRFVENVPIDDSTPESITLTWRQRWAQRDTSSTSTSTPSTPASVSVSVSISGSGNRNNRPATSNTTRDLAGVPETWQSGIHILSPQEVQRRAREMNPGLEAEKRSRVNAYYRVGCTGLLTWFDVFTE